MTQERIVAPSVTEQASFDVGVLRAIQNIAAAVYKMSPGPIRDGILLQLEHDRAHPAPEWTSAGEIAAFEIPLGVLEDVITAVEEAEAAAGLPRKRSS